MVPFDPYHKWLGIPPDQQPVSHYRLLGIEDFELDADVIEGAAERQTVYLRTFQTGPNSELAERLLNEVSESRVCLLDGKSKARYDRQLRAALDPPPEDDPLAFTTEELAAVASKPATRSRSRSRGGKPFWQEPWAIPAAAGGIVVLLLLLMWINSGGDNSLPVGKQQGPATAKVAQKPKVSAKKTEEEQQAELERLVEERVKQELAQAEQARLAKEKAEAERLAAAEEAAGKAAAEKATAEKLAAKTAMEKAAKEKLAAEKVAAEKAAAKAGIDITLDRIPIGIALTGRKKGMKETLLAAYGGTARTEAAVKLGLEWLKKNQGRDGLWSLTGPYRMGSGVENRAAATAMALLAFQGAGHTHKTGEHREVVRKAWTALLRTQDTDGSFFKQGSFHHRLYTDAQATIAICELYGMTKDLRFKAPAQKALDYCFRIQSPAGGWRYKPNGESDTSVTGWFVMATYTGVMAGLKVPSEKLKAISQYLDQATTDGGSQYGYRPGYGEKISMTAEGLLCRQYLGWKHDDPRLVRGANIVGENPMNWDEQDVYYWYYATQMLHHMGGEWWNKWNRVMRETIPEHQTTSGPEKGSWSPSDDAWGHQGGRLFTTCLSIYMLEVYYRHLPIYKSKLR